MLSEEDIRRATYLHEGAIPDVVQRHRWLNVVARGDAGVLDKRIRWAAGQSQKPDPSWVAIASQIVQSSPLQVALSLMEARTSAWHALPKQAQEQLHQWLRKRLSVLPESEPLALRLAAQWVAFWCEAVTAFLERFQADRPALEEAFGANNIAVGEIVEIVTGLSDHHHHGQSAMALTLSSGFRLVYKPKSLGIDVAFQEVLRWCNGKSLSLPLKTLRIVSGDGYGWMEYFETEPGTRATSIEGRDVRNLSRRAGMLTALLYAFRATDCHRANVLSDGKDIALVDAETLMHPDARSFLRAPDIERELDLGLHPFFDSVNRTGVLTHWASGPDGVVDMGAFSHLSSDAAGEVRDGFREMYCMLLDNRDELLATETFRGIRTQRVRFIFRATAIYDALLKRSLKPECLGSGVDRSIEIDLLSRAFLAADEKPYAWPLLEAETEALAVGDIPLFATTCDSTALQFGITVPIENYFKQSGYERCVTQIQSLTPEDLAFQESIVSAAFLCKRATCGAGIIPEMDLKVHLPNTDELLSEAEAIGRELRSNFVRAKDGSARWVTLAASPALGRFQIRPLGDDLYSGQIGVGLFLAALYRGTGNPLDRQLALDAISYLRNGNWRRRMSKYLGLGGMTGLGSIVFGLVRMSRLLGDPDLLDEANEFAAMITPDLIHADKSFDVMSGSAGAALGLLALHTATNSSEVLSRAEDCGRHVSALYKPSLAGFAHGAAGVAYAMNRLLERTGYAEFQQVAENCLALERGVFSKELGNWPDLRTLPAAFPVRWCHGASGVGLGRIGSGTAAKGLACDWEIAAAVRTTLDHSCDDVDHLCCGNAGRLELLVAAGLIEEARYRAGWMIERKRQLGGYSLSADLPVSVVNPGFFQGISGIGYTLLRLSSPERFPSVLLLEG